MTHYELAITQLHGRASKKIANNTYARQEQDCVVFKLHNTDIVTVSADDMVTLNSGGWKTPTTKSRMNDILSSVGLKAYVYQEHSIWYLRIGPYTADSPTYPYSDNMTIDGTGTVNGAGVEPKAEQKLARRVTEYARAYAHAFVTGKIEKPGPGDCFYCHMETVPDRHNLGEVLGDTEHILSHLDEKYFVPSLLVNAIKHYPVSQFAQWVISAQWGNGEKFADNGIAERQIATSVREYVKSQVNLARSGGMILA
jgi:hypothetical protein